MGYNVPSYDTGKMSLGPGILYMCDYSSGTSPSTDNDVGAVHASVFRVTRTKVPVYQGSPQVEVTAFAQREEVQLECTGIEWNFQTLYKALGAGTATAMSVAEPSFEFGDTVTFANVSIWLRHQMAGGSYLHVYLWRANGSGEIEITLGDDVHEFPYVFTALEESSDWAGSSLDAGKRLYKMKKSVTA